jgi:hypothetical protein
VKENVGTSKQKIKSKKGTDSADKTKNDLKKAAKKTKAKE